MTTKGLTESMYIFTYSKNADTLSGAFVSVISSLLRSYDESVGQSREDIALRAVLADLAAQAPGDWPEAIRAHFLCNACQRRGCPGVCG